MEVDTLGQIAAGLIPVVAERARGKNPFALAGRIVGMGDAEMKAGIPKWAWCGIGIVAGVSVMWAFGDKIKSVAGRKR